MVVKYDSSGPVIHPNQEGINFSALLRELTDMKKIYKDQNFTFSKDQQEKYDFLLEIRRLRIGELRNQGRVWVGPSDAGKVKEEDKD